MALCFAFYQIIHQVSDAAKEHPQNIQKALNHPTYQLEDGSEQDIYEEKYLHLKTLLAIPKIRKISEKNKQYNI
ncbi:hypothetical protein ACMZ4Y_04835 [Prevotella histicola]|jgi:hypothetical protein|nr:hypothetical protein [Segatella oris]DAS41047.1 MAG TPA: hypothetical protein [Caudoviricetes sp.]